MPDMYLWFVQQVPVTSYSLEPISSWAGRYRGIRGVEQAVGTYDNKWKGKNRRSSPTFSLRFFNGDLLVILRTKGRGMGK